MRENARPQRAHYREGQHEGRHRQEHVGHAHDRLAEAPTHVAGDDAERTPSTARRP